MPAARANLRTAEQYIARCIPFRASNFYGESINPLARSKGFRMMLGGEVVPSTADYIVKSYDAIIAYHDGGRLYVTSGGFSKTTQKHINICKPGAYWAGTSELAK